MVWGNKENPLLAFKWMKAAAESGHALAQHGLGFKYEEIALKKMVRPLFIGIQKLQAKD